MPALSRHLLCKKKPPMHRGLRLYSVKLKLFQADGLDHFLTTLADNQEGGTLVAGF